MCIDLVVHAYKPLIWGQGCYIFKLKYFQYKNSNSNPNSYYLVWPPAALRTTVHFILMDCTRFASYCCEMLPHF